MGSYLSMTWGEVSVTGSYDAWAEIPILEERDQIGQEASVKRLAILESNNDLFCLMVFHMRMQRLQVIIEILAALS